MIKDKYTRKMFETRKANGLCLNCGKPMDREGRNCIACTEKKTKYNKEVRAMFRRYGICPKCGKEKLWGDEKNCIECRTKYSERAMATRDKDHYNQLHRDWARAEHQRRIENGMCTRCNKRKADYGYKTCGVCREKGRKAYIEKRSNPYRKEKRLAAGLCYFCDNPIKEGFRVCEYHYERNVNSSRKADKSTGKKLNDLAYRRAVNQ